MPILLKTDGLDRVYRSGGETVYALKNLNLEIQGGRLTMLKGRSGSGKTTLINLLGALDRPSKGAVYFDGSKISSLSERRRDDFRRKRMGFVFQSIALISMMSAYENVEFGLKVAGYERSDIRARTKECLNLVGLGKRMDHRPHELSGGEQQRVAIARAIAHKPDVVFADEPTAELDTHLGLQVVRLFRSLVENEGITVVMTTHDPSMVEVADHVFTLQDGEIANER